MIREIGRVMVVRIEAMKGVEKEKVISRCNVTIPLIIFMLVYQFCSTIGNPHPNHPNHKGTSLSQIKSIVLGIYRDNKEPNSIVHD